MKILVRLPNWLGDMVMAVGFMHQLPHFFPGAEISVIAKEGIGSLLDFFPPHHHRFIFSKQNHRGALKLYRFGKGIRKEEKFDLFISLPDSLSSALIGFGSGATERIGYKKDLRNILLTHSFTKPKGLHRVEEYVQLLQHYTGQHAAPIQVSLHHDFLKKDHVVVNINSEASSRRLTIGKAVEVITILRQSIDNRILLIGSIQEQEFVNAVLSKIPDQKNIESLAGKTDLTQLVEVLATAQALLTTDSGPSHLANALGTNTIVLFGPGREQNTSPYNKELVTTIRLGQLSCEPCEKNICYRFDTPQCLERLDAQVIASNVKLQLTHA